MDGADSMSWKLIITLLVIGHTTTAPWNSFINNNEYYKWKLNGSPEMKQQSYGNATTQQNIIACCMGLADYDPTKCNVTMQVPVCTGKECEDTIDSTEYAQKVMNCYTTPVDAAAVVDDCGSSVYSKFWDASLSSVSLAVTFFAAALSIFLVTVPNSQFARVYGMLFIVMCVFIASITMIWQVGTVDRCNVQTFFGGTLVLVVMVILSSGIAQASFFALTGPMHFTYVVYLMEGQGLGGIFIAVMQIILSAIFKVGGTWGVGGSYADSVDLQISSSIYFGVVLFTTILAIYLFHTVFIRCPEYLKFHNDKREIANSDVSDIERKQLVVDSKTMRANHVSLLTIIKHILPLMFSVFANFFLCLSLFPSVHLQVRSEFSDADIFGVKSVNYDFIYIAVFLVFNIGDWLGKKFSGRRFWSPHSTHITVISELVRIPIFYAAFFMTDITGARDSLFSKAWFFVIVMALFALTSGYFGSMPMNHACEVLEKKLMDDNAYTEKAINDAKQRAMTVMLLGLLGGLMIGALCNFPLMSYVNKMAEKERFDLQAAYISKQFAN